MRRRSSRCAAGSVREQRLGLACGRPRVGADRGAAAGAAMPSRWSSSASSRCTGRDLGVALGGRPADGAETASWLLVVRRSASKGRSSQVSWSPGTTLANLSRFRSTLVEAEREGGHDEGIPGRRPGDPFVHAVELQGAGVRVVEVTGRRRVRLARSVRGLTRVDERQLDIPRGVRRLRLARRLTGTSDHTHFCRKSCHAGLC